MNELQIRLSADISALTTALNKAKATIKSFESDTEKESEKGNVGFRRKIGLIEQLTNKAKALRTALSQATNEQQIERYNQELEQTTRELTRLNALGRSVTANIGSTTSSFQRAGSAIGGTNAVAIEFNRIIQDAPFGLIGIGNNLQQLAGNLAQVSKQAGGTGAAIKASLASIISPVNLGLLAVSALTAGFTAYQMGAFDFIKSTEDATDAVEKYNEEIQKTIDNLSAFEKVSLNTANSVEKEKIEIDSLFNILKDTNLSQETRVGAYNKLISLYPNLLKGLSQEKALTGDLTTEYKLLTEAIGQKALAAALEGELIDSFKEQFDIQKQLNAEKKAQSEIEDQLLNVLIEEERQARLVREVNKDGLALRGQELQVDRSRSQALNEQLEKQKEIVRLTERLLTAQGSEAEQLKTQLLEANKQVAVLFGFGQSPDPIKPLEETVKRTREDLSELNTLLERAALLRKEAFFEGVEAPLARRESGQQITQGVLIPDLPVDEFEEQGLKIQEVNRAISDSFSSLGIGIASSLNISNNAFKGFITTVLSATPKIIQAILAQSAAKKLAAKADIATNSQVAGSEGIAVASKAANALGPVGLALLPVFIGGALALISGAFNNIGGGGKISGGGGGSASVGRPPQIFTNSQIPRPPGSSAPTPTGNIDFGNAQGRLEARIDGNDIVFVYDRTKERQQGGG